MKEGVSVAESLNLIQKLAKIRALSDVAKKSKQGYGYSYTDVTEILANVSTGMKKYGVSLIPSIVPGTGSVNQNVTVNTKTDKLGKAYDKTDTEMVFCADMVFKWINDDNPDEYIEVPWFVTGSMSDCAQAMGSGLTYTMRQFLTSYFQIAQSSDLDVDAYRSKQKAAEVAEDKAIAEEIIGRFDVIVKQFLADNQEKSEEVKKFISRFAKNANYFAIKEPTLAAKLLEDFQNTFIKSKE